MNKVIHIFFGEMGAGKNYWGERFAQRNDYDFFDGDTVATPEMIARVSKFKSLTRDIVSHYVHNVLGQIILFRATVNKKNLVVAQALYSDIDRKVLGTMLRNCGFSVHYHWAKTSWWKNIKQLFSRKSGFRWVIYWIMNKPFFQKPTHTWSLANLDALGITNGEV